MIQTDNRRSEGVKLRSRHRADVLRHGGSVFRDDGVAQEPEHRGVGLRAEERDVLDTEVVVLLAGAFKRSNQVPVIGDERLLDFREGIADALFPNDVGELLVGDAHRNFGGTRTLAALIDVAALEVVSVLEHQVEPAGIIPSAFAGSHRKELAHVHLVELLVGNLLEQIGEGVDSDLGTEARRSDVSDRVKQGDTVGGLQRYGFHLRLPDAVVPTSGFVND